MPVPGCTSETADNHNPRRTKTTVHAFSLDCAELELRACRGRCSELARTLTHYANFSSNDVELTAVYGTDTEPWTLVGEEAFYQDDWIGLRRKREPLLFGAFPSLEYDTWWTIGAEPGNDDSLNSAFDAALTSFDDWSAGSDFVVNTFVGGSISLCLVPTHQVFLLMERCCSTG